MEDNLSAVLRCRNNIQLEQRPIPKAGKNEVVIKMDSVGICGSDVHYWTKGCIGDFIVKAPMVLGHESSGIIHQLGDGVEHLKVGDRVAIEPGIPCRMCYFCKAGRYNLCSDVKFCATPPIDGTLTRYYVHAADFCFRLPDHVSLEEGALLEPLSVAVHACRRAGVSVGNKVLICGAGPIGLVNVLTAKAIGASQICVTDICQNRINLAAKLGANHTLLINQPDCAALAKEIHTLFGEAPDVVIECSGAESSLRLGIMAVRTGGTIVIIGLGPEEVKIPIINAAVREVDIRGVFRYANCYPLALNLVASGAVNVIPLITHRFKLEETLKAFETAKTGAGGAVKVIINCQAK